MSKIRANTGNLMPRKRMALYARVSTQEQTRGNYPSCQSQIEELEQFCKSQDWQVEEIIKDEGVSAGTLKRQGMARLRHLIESGQIDGVLCTWYDRLTRSRDFYVLDKEFKTHNVEFITLHDPTDRHTASGRFLETMLVAAKTYEREQTAEKVRTKMRMRAEKGLWNGGLVPFGFKVEPGSQVFVPDAAKRSLLEQMFRVYIDTRSDFAVRDYLQAHQIPAPGGKPTWTPSSIRDLLMNRRYIAEIEINKANKGIDGLPEFESYRIVPAPHEPLVPRELWEMAQAIRQEKAANSPNRGGKTRSYSQNQCGRVYLLQGHMTCGICGQAMTPYYVCHKPNEKEKRRTTSYIHRYMCAQRIKYRGQCDHNNYVLAKTAEKWVLDSVAQIVNSADLIEQAVDVASGRTETTLQPQKEALLLCDRALIENQQQVDEFLETARQAKGALLAMLTEKAEALMAEREQLRSEKRRLAVKLTPLDNRPDTTLLRRVLSDFTLICEKLEPVELQRLLRLLVRRVEWMPDGTHRAHFYAMPQKNGSKSDDNRPSGSLVTPGAKLAIQGQPLHTFLSNQ